MTRPAEPLSVLETSWDARHGRCGVFDGETTCGRLKGHHEGPLATDHRFYDPSGSGRWIETDAYGKETARGGGWAQPEPEVRKIAQLIEVNRDVLMDMGLVRDTRPPVPPPPATRVRRWVVTRREAARTKIALRIAPWLEEDDS